MQLFLFILDIFTDEEFRKLQAGNTDCIEKLYYKYKTVVYNYLLFKLNNNEHNAYDLLADTFEAVIISVPKLKNQNNLSAWIIGIARNLVSGYFKKLKNNKKIIEYIQINKSHVSPDIIEELDKNYRYSLLMTAFNQLKPLQQKIFELKYIERKKVKEIAGILDKTEDSVASSLKRMKNKLQITIQSYR